MKKRALCPVLAVTRGGKNLLPQQKPKGLQSIFTSKRWLQLIKIRGWTKEAIARAKKDCAAFQSDNAALLDQYREAYKPKGDYANRKGK